MCVCLCDPRVLLIAIVVVISPHPHLHRLWNHPFPLCSSWEHWTMLHIHQTFVVFVFQIGWILNSVHREEEGTFDGLIWTTTNHSLVVVFFSCFGVWKHYVWHGQKINPYSLKQINGYPYISPLNTTHVPPLKGKKTRPYSGLQGIRHVCRVNKQKSFVLIIKLFLEASLGIYYTWRKKQVRPS